jgi:hypothetical protein
MPPFGPGATASTKTISGECAGARPGNWRERHLPGNPRIAGRRHSPDWCLGTLAPIAGRPPTCARSRLRTVHRSEAEITGSGRGKVFSPCDLPDFGRGGLPNRCWRHLPGKSGVGPPAPIPGLMSTRVDEQWARPAGRGRRNRSELERRQTLTGATPFSGSTRQFAGLWPRRHEESRVLFVSSYFHGQTRLYPSR